MRLDLLYAHAADLGIEVEWCHLSGSRRGEYRDDDRTILLAHGLTRVQATATLAHELGHALHRDICSTPANEKRAWEVGAALVISVGEYAAAEREVGEHPGALAVALEVTPVLVEGWRRWYRRTSDSRRARNMSDDD